jgi:predicted esterase
MADSSETDRNTDPHAGQPILTVGPPPQQAPATLVLVHGRGGTAQDMLGLYEELAIGDLAALAPQAAGSTWYPHSFLQPLQRNQPWLDSALRRIASIVSHLLDQGIAGDRIAILGFSQGACLTLEFTARHPRRYGAIMGLTGGLIGPDGTPRDYPGSLDGTPVLLAAPDPDPHIPFQRVRDTETVLMRMDAVVETRRYPGLPHSINQDQLEVCRTMLRRLVSST